MSTLTINNSPSAKIDMIHKKGNAFSFALQIVDGAGDPTDIEDAAFTMRILNDIGEEVALFDMGNGLTMNVAGNEVSFTEPVATLDALIAMAYNYEFYIADAGGNTSLLHGKFKIVDAAHKVSLASIAQNNSLFQITLGANSSIKIQGQMGIPGATGADGEDGAPGATGAPGAGYLAISTSTYALQLGAFQFETSAGLAYAIGMRVRIAIDLTRYAEGVVTNYVGTTLSVLIDRVVGSGTFNHWNIGIAGDVGAKGDPGDPGGGGASAWGAITGTLSNQTDLQNALDAKQASDADLTAIAALSPANDDIIQRKAGSWINRTLAQLATDLGLSNYFNKSSDDTDDVTVGATNKFATAAEKTKLGFISVTQAVDLDAIETNSNASKVKTDFITVTQAVDLDAIETRVNDLDAAVVLKGTWSAAGGTFPGSGVAQAGWSYLVTADGTVDGIEFKNGDRVIAIIYNASTTTYASNWYKADYTDRVSTVAGRTGAVVITSSDLADFNAAALAAAPAETTTTAGALINSAADKPTPVDADSFGIRDSAASGILKELTWTNLKATLLTYFDTLYLSRSNEPECFQIACSDLTTVITAGTSKAYFRAPYAFSLLSVRASLLTAQTGGSIFTVDINDNGTSILSTKLTLDNNETTSTTAATPAVISSSSIGDDRIITIDVDTVGTGSPVGLIVTLIGKRTV